MNLRIFVLFSGILLFLSSCNSTDTVILKSKSDLGLLVGDEVFFEENPVGNIQNIQTIKGEVIYTVVMSGKIRLKKNSVILLDYSFLNNDPYLRVRNKGVGDAISTKDTITINTSARKKESIDKLFKNLVDSLLKQQK